MKAITRRLGKLEGARASSEPVCADPMTGELVEIDQLLRFASETELTLAETALTGACEPRDGEYPKRCAAMSKTERGSLYVALNHLWHDKRRRSDNEGRLFTEADWDILIAVSASLEPVEVVA